MIERLEPVNLFVHYYIGLADKQAAESWHSILLAAPFARRRIHIWISTIDPIHRSRDT